MCVIKAYGGRGRAMSRIINILIAVIVIVVAYLTVRYAKEFYASSPPSVESVKELPHGLPATNFHAWREFTAPNQEFRVLLPIVPQHVADKILDPETKESRKFDTFVAATDQGAAFMISAITFPRKLEGDGAEDVLKGVINDMLARNKDNQLHAMNFANFRNYKAMDFSLSNGELLIAGKVFIRGNALYILSMINRGDLFDGKELDFFINSFSILKDSTKALPPSEMKGAAPQKNKGSKL